MRISNPIPLSRSPIQTMIASSTRAMPTPKELVEQAMSQSHPASIPVMCQLANGHTIINTRVHPIDYFTSDEVWADCLLQMRKLYDFDGILCHNDWRARALTPGFPAFDDSVT